MGRWGFLSAVTTAMGKVGIEAAIFCRVTSPWFPVKLSTWGGSADKPSALTWFGWNLGSGDDPRRGELCPIQRLFAAADGE